MVQLCLVRGLAVPGSARSGLAVPAQAWRGSLEPGRGNSSLAGPS